MTTLVTGAAGGAQGSTGRHVAELLLDNGVPVRAFVRTFDERAERLRGLGADIVAGDLREIADVGPAMAGVDRVFFTYPVRDGLLDATATVAAAAKAAGVKRLVEVSQLRPRADAHSPRTRQHWLSEQVFDWAGVGAVHLRATVFYENIRALAREGAAAGELAVPLGDEQNAIPLVSAGDVARVAARLLVDVDGSVEPFYLLVGQVPTVAEIVATFGEVFGTAMRYTNVDSTVWRENALARYGNEHAVAHLSRLWQVLASQREVRATDAVERVTGSPAETLSDFLRADFQAQADLGQ